MTIEVATTETTPARDAWRRWVLLVLAASTTYVGVWALLAPAGLYRSFPGFGWHWVASAGPYDEHLVRDVGALSLALLVPTLAAVVRPSAWNLRVAAVAWLLYSVPHLAFHAVHVSGSDRVQLIPLGLLVLLPLLLLLPGRGRRGYISGGM